MKNNPISSIKFNSIVSLDNDTDSDPEFKEFKEAVSSTIKDSRTISWTRFILTDDQPNENKMRIPKTEFSNLINTGTYMPFKMAYDKPKDGHEESFPLGVIATLKESGNQIIALAALWKREREQDIEYLKTCIAEKTPVNVSWEILHDDSKFDENGIEDLIGTSLRAVTVVGRPAYAGRTPVLEVASKKIQENNSEDITLDELEKLQKDVVDLKEELSSKEIELAEKETLIAEKEAELVPLREFKASAEAEAAALAKFQEVKNVFVTAGLEKPDTYFEDNKDRLLNMDQASLDFMVQELAASASANKGQSNSSKEGTEIPDLTGDAPKELDIKELANELRKSSK